MQKTEKQQTTKSRQEVLKDLTEQLEKSIHEFMQGDRYKSFLTQMSKLHAYSLNNQLLIASQRPDATLCASYTTWKKNNRNVKRGEKGIKIICPSFHKVQTLQDVKDPKTGKPEYLPNGKAKKEIVEKIIPFYKAGVTFDISQTEGEPLTEIASELKGSLDSRQNELKETLLEISPVPVHFQPVSGEANGYYDLTKKHSLKTLVHELAHSLIHDTDIPDAPRDSPTREVQAESIAYVVCQYFGLDTSEYSFGYISTWSSGKDTQELKNSLEIIRNTSNDIISKVEQKLTKTDSLKQAENISAIPKRKCM